MILFALLLHPVGYGESLSPFCNGNGKKPADEWVAKPSSGHLIIPELHRDKDPAEALVIYQRKG